MKIYGLTGKARNGKDSFYKEVKKIIPDAVRVAFGDEVKIEVSQVTGFTVEYIEANKDIFRPMLQFWATEFRRNLVAKDYWIKRIKIRPCDLDKPIFVTDLRFENEAEFIRSKGGKIIRVIKSNHSSNDTHKSETELEGIKADYTIVAKDRGELAIEVQKFLALEKPCNK
jgi:hypothetical protein